MFSTDTYVNRRTQLTASLSEGMILLLGNKLSSMNYKDNTYPFRQDSSFLYYFGIDQPDLAATIDLGTGNTTIYGDDPDMQMVVWTGPQTPLAELAARVGVTSVKPFHELESVVKIAASKGTTIHYLPPYRPENAIKLHQWLGIPFEQLNQRASVFLIQAVVTQRAVKSDEELMEMEKATNVSRAMHLAAMQQARPGMKEAQLAGLVEGIAVAGGGQLSYPVILTINGHILHNHHHHNILRPGQLVLGDFGAETAMRYAGDITRTFPVDAAFTPRQKAVYEIVLAAETQAITAVKPGVTYAAIHRQAATIITEGLKDLGIMRGDTAEAVELGAPALFFPHGLGHMIGLDVHDMEDLGEDYVGYDAHTRRSKLFGYRSLRLGRALQAGFVLTVEPGLYFIPPLIQQWRAERKFEAFINYAEVENYLDFTGIRIEDNVVVTETGSRVLGNPIPKTVAEVEAIRHG